MIKDIIKNNKYCISIEDNLICIKNYIRIIDISESYIKIKLNNKIVKIANIPILEFLILFKCFFIYYLQ